MDEKHPEVLRLFPPPTQRLSTVYEDLTLNPTYPGPGTADDLRPHVLMNMVSSLDGRVASAGKAGGIGSPADRRAMRVLRSRVDAVMVGAGTLRAEKMSLTSEGLRSPEPWAIVVTGGGDLALKENLLGADRDRTVVVVPESLPKGERESLERQSRVIPVPQDNAGRPNLTKTLSILRQHLSADTILVEGGPTLNHSLLSENLVDELCLTISPKILGGGAGVPAIVEGSAFVSGYAPSAKIAAIYLSENELFLRYTLPN